MTPYAGAVLLVLFAALYLLTLDDGLRPAELAGGDLITHQYAQVQGRPSNAPGYPLYTMGGWLWFRLGRAVLGPDDNPIPILSAYSTLWALLALALLYRLVLDVTAHPGAAESDAAPPDGNWPVAFLVTAFYGLTYFFWYYAVTTEQYTSSVAWTLAVVWLAFRWERTRRDGYLLALALLAGVGLAHQVTVLLVGPPVLWFVLSREPHLLRRPRLLLAAAGLALLPLVSYAFVYVRGLQHLEWRGAGEWASAGQWFWSFVSTQQGRSELTWALQPLFTPEFPALIWGEMTWPGLIAGLLGVAVLPRPRAVMLYAALALYALFAWVDRLGNWFQVIMPTYALLSLGLAAGADWAWRWTTNRGRATPALCGLNLLLLAALVLTRGALSYPRADSSGRPDDTALAPAWAILADEPPPGTAVFGTQAEALALSYVTEIWDQRPDLQPVTSDQARALLPGGSVAVTQAALPLVPLEISPDARYNALGRTLARLSLEPEMDLSGAWLPWTHDYGSGLRLAGGNVSRNLATNEVVVLLAWQAGAAPQEEWSVSVRLARAGQEIAQADQAHPVFGAYPMTRWQPGEVVTDAYAFSLPQDAAPDSAVVIVYRATEVGFTNLGAATFPLAAQLP